MKVLGALGGLFCALCVREAQAESGPAWLAWAAPPECPTAGDIEQRARELFGGPLPEERRLAVKTELRWLGDQWKVWVDVAVDGYDGQRAVKVGTCSQAADFVAVAVVLAVDPTSSERLSEAGPHEEPASPAPAQPEREVPVAAASGAAAASAKLAAQTRSIRVTPHVSAAAEATIGVLPAVQFGASLGAGTDIERVSLGLALEWHPNTATAFEDARGPIEFGLIAGRANVGYWFLGPTIRLGPSLWVHAGAMQSSEVGANRPAVHEPWVAVGAGPQAVVRLGGAVSVLAEGELVIPLVMPTFVLDDGSEVHEPGVGGRLSLGARISFGQ